MPKKPSPLATDAEASRPEIVAEAKRAAATNSGDKSDGRRVPAPGVGSLKRKRVAMVVYSQYPADPRPRRAVDVLVKQGMTVDLVCLRDANEPKHQVAGDIDVRRIPITHRRGGKFLYVYNYLAFLLMASAIVAFRCVRNRYDLVYVHNMPDILILSAVFPKLLGAKVILDVHDPMPELMTTIFGLKQTSRSVRLIRFLEAWSMARADAVVTVNTACKRIFSERSCNADKISVVMNSPDGQIFPFRALEPRVSGRGRPGNRLTVMYHGSLVERNGLDLAVAAMTKVRKTIPGVEFKIYGRETPFLDEVMADVQKMGLQHCIRYLGSRRQEELVEAIENCDVGVIPNHRNAFTDINTPTRLFEYLALGKPVIAPRTRGIQDYFGPESLVFFESGNADDLAKSIEYVFFHPDEARETAKRGQEVYRDHEWSQEQQVLVNVVAELLDESRPN